MSIMNLFQKSLPSPPPCSPSQPTCCSGGYLVLVHLHFQLRWNVASDQTLVWTQEQAILFSMSAGVRTEFPNLKLYHQWDCISFFFIQGILWVVKISVQVKQSSFGSNRKKSCSHAFRLVWLSEQMHVCCTVTQQLHVAREGRVLVWIY